MGSNPTPSANPAAGGLEASLWDENEVRAEDRLPQASNPTPSANPAAGGLEASLWDENEVRAEDRLRQAAISAGACQGGRCPCGPDSPGWAV